MSKINILHSEVIEKLEKIVIDRKVLRRKLCALIRKNVDIFRRDSYIHTKLGRKIKTGTIGTYSDSRLIEHGKEILTYKLTINRPFTFSNISFSEFFKIMPSCNNCIVSAACLENTRIGIKINSVCETAQQEFTIYYNERNGIS